MSYTPKQPEAIPALTHEQIAQRGDHPNMGPDHPEAGGPGTYDRLEDPFDLDAFDGFQRKVADALKEHDLEEIRQEDKLEHEFKSRPRRERRARRRRVVERSGPPKRDRSVRRAPRPRIRPLGVELDSGLVYELERPYARIAFEEARKAGKAVIELSPAGSALMQRVETDEQRIEILQAIRQQWVEALERGDL